MSKLKPLIIGNLAIPIPIIQGGMGIQVSTAPLAAAVANGGGAGIIASVGLGFGELNNKPNFIEASNKGLQREIREARRLSPEGILGVNAMVALSNYEELVKTASKEEIDFIVSGAGLPLNLPRMVERKSIKLIPIVSSARALKIIIRSWERCDKIPDAIVVEGPLAGGHLGFKMEEFQNNSHQSLEEITAEVLELLTEKNLEIPVILAGGIFNGKDIAKFIKLGVAGVQIGSRFVCTHECSVHDKFKKAYLEATENDIKIISSPVGMPGRAILNPFLKKVLNGEKRPVNCPFNCLKTCKPEQVQYCISIALHRAVLGDMENGLVFCGSRTSEIEKIVSVEELINELVKETIENL